MHKPGQVPQPAEELEELEVDCEPCTSAIVGTTKSCHLFVAENSWVYTYFQNYATGAAHDLSRFLCFGCRQSNVKTACSCKILAL